MDCGLRIGDWCIRAFVILDMFMGSAVLASSPFKSAPAQNARPFPVRMPTRMLGSSSSHSQTACRSAWPWAFMQFRSRGRFSVTRRMWGAG